MAEYIYRAEPIGEGEYSHTLVGELVRCGECKNFTEYRHGNGWCALHETDLICRDDFCSRGERRADE